MKPGTLIGLGLYCLLLLLGTAVRAEAIKGSYGEWFFISLDWYSFGTSALAGLIGGFIRTLATIRSREPTLRVAVELIGDALVALVSGATALLLIMAWVAVVGNPVQHTMTFVLGVVAGYTRGGLMSALAETLKRLLAVLSDGAINWAARVFGAMASKTAGNPPAEDKQ